MSVKRDPSGRRSIQVAAEVPGTPEEVWRAIATGPGISSWFEPTDVEERVGGVLKYRTGSGTDDVPARVAAWDPPRRFRYEGKDCGPEGPPTAAEWTIEPRSGGHCLVRLVHSLVAGTDDWDDQLENFENGWPLALAILRLYLTHFGGQRATIVRAYGAVDGSVEDAWNALLSTLAAGALAPGDPWALPDSGDASLAGVVEELRPAGRQPYILFRLGRPAPGIAETCVYKIAERATVVLTVYFYGDEGAAAARDAAGWQSWIKARFP
ncbi:MAG: SRPBCC domain-containing protein [Acidobacteria bacterium]|nr:SRPBCC domain-containing protein [Acidobacteriota bacterium]